ncbi:MAG: hypothetical protein R2795_12970 [Saprospiraceae bacterium]
MDQPFSNPFDEMENDGIRSFYDNKVDVRVKSKLDNTMGTIRFLSNIADVYLSKLVDTVVGMTSHEQPIENTDDEGINRISPPDTDKHYPNL